MAFDKVKTQETNMSTFTPGKVNPWARFPKDPKTNRGRDLDAVAMRFRYLQELEDMIISRTHWDDDLKKPVDCTRTFERNPKDGKYWPKGNCWYCTKRKAFQDQWKQDKANGVKPAADQQYAPKTWAMQATLVAPVAMLVPKLNEDKSPVVDDDGEPVMQQEFKLLPLEVLDLYYSVAKGFYDTLTKIVTKKKTLKKHWFELTPANYLSSEDTLTKDDIKAQVVGLENLEEQVDNAAPFSYDEAMKLRAKLDNDDAATESYADAEAEVEKEKDKETTKKKTQTKADTSNDVSDYDDEIPPF